MTRGESEACVVDGDEVLARQGYACLFSAGAGRMAALDARMRGLFSGEAVEEWHVSSMIDEADMARCGYISGFPTQLTVAATIDPQAYGRVAACGCVESGDILHRKKHLTPAACLNIYPMLGRLQPDGRRIVTTLATVFRHEQHFDGLARLWEFKVREFVVVGERGYVLDQLQRACSAAVRLARDLGLDPTIAEASDHFYPSRANRVRQMMQAGVAMKRELHVGFGGEALSLASFNFHGTHFSAAFGFDRNASVTTGCVGFGLSRWLAVTQDASGLAEAGA